MQEKKKGPEASLPEEELEFVAPSEDRLSMEDLYPVQLQLSADLGKCTLLVRDVLELKRGSVLPMDKQAGEMADIYVRGIPLAKGEVVVLGDSLHVRIAEIFGLGEKDGWLYD